MVYIVVFVYGTTDGKYVLTLYSVEIAVSIAVISFLTADSGVRVPSVPMVVST